ncbi:transposase, partial [Uliginosibacterium gangwonense]|uniref:transposase n=3 Tax=Uliginosibacterium gangwonense TaxID=392736 RepID=UPI00037D9C4D
MQKTLALLHISVKRQQSLPFDLAAEKIVNSLLEPVHNHLNVVSCGMRKKYPSDVSREAFEQIRPLLESVRKQTKPRTVDLYDVFCGVLYLLKSGCQWRMLPSEYPKWRTVHAYFAKWSELGPDGLSV